MDSQIRRLGSLLQSLDLKYLGVLLPVNEPNRRSRRSEEGKEYIIVSVMSRDALDESVRYGTDEAGNWKLCRWRNMYHDTRGDEEIILLPP
ncbi:unnamed protein product [Dovyalis caffra]|uniref:Uncharacterized protein n=1 Tax=Dovyalis caffra TaxID=77055 RepID=A0AAV1RAE7_9ROSI|nr:unnamed protein product [Dovyalis caffra]